MKEIKLSKTGKKKVLSLVTLVDDEDFEYLNQFNWNAKKDCNTFYAVRSQSKNQQIRMHRVLLGVTDKSIVVDHIDGNGLNNQKSNLRKATNSQNIRNRRPKRNSSSKYLGVCWRKHLGKWDAQIEIGGVSKYLGSFTNENDAAIAYNKAALAAWGEFASLNKISSY